MTAIDLEALHHRWSAELESELPDAIALRHRLHADPRVSGDESDTADAVVAALPDGVVRRIVGTGALVRYGGAGPAIALRAELDGLPITERTGVPHAASGSVMHACGHDVHLAGLVAVCHAAQRISLPVPLEAILQPREERPPSGAADIAASPAATDWSAIVAAHVQPQLPDGSVGVDAGPVNAGTDEIEIVVEGRGGHGGYPHTVRDPVLAMCQIVVSLQQLASRRVDPTVGTVLSIGQLHAGTSSNVVPDRAVATGSFRVMRDSDREALLATMREIVTHTALAHGCTATLLAEQAEPVLVNDEALATGASGWLTRSGEQIASFRSFGADDFAHYCAITRGLMVFVGTGRTGDGAAEEAGLHSDRFLPADRTVRRIGHALIAGYLAAVPLASPRTE